MATLAQARARWLSENPIGSPGYDLSQADYNVMANDRATIMLAQMNQTEADAARALLRRRYRAARSMLDAPVGTTPAQVRQAVVEHRTILSGLIEILRDSGLVLDDS